MRRPAAVHQVAPQPRRTFGATALAVALGVGVGWLDLHTTEVLTTIVALLLAGVLLGLPRPGGAWRSAGLLAAGLPVMAVAGHLLGVRTPEPIRLDPRVWLVALGLGLVGCHVGAAMRRLAGPATQA